MIFNKFLNAFKKNIVLTKYNRYYHSKKNINVEKIFHDILDKKKKTILLNDKKMKRIIDNCVNLDVNISLNYTDSDKKKKNYPWLNNYLGKIIVGENSRDLNCKLIHLVARFSSYNIFKHFICKKIFITSEFSFLSERDSHFLTPFHYLCLYLSEENLINYIKFYKNYNKNLFDETDIYGFLPLFFILHNKYTSEKILTFLIEFGVDFNKISINKNLRCNYVNYINPNHYAFVCEKLNKKKYIN